MPTLRRRVAFRSAFRHLLSLSFLVALDGCTSSTIPLAEHTLIGEFGGDNSLLHATSSGATIEYGCSLVTIPAPLATDPQGKFTVDGLRQRVGGALLVATQRPTPVAVDGLAVSAGGGTVRLIVRDAPNTASPSSFTDTLVLVRDRAAIVYKCP